MRIGAVRVALWRTLVVLAGLGGVAGLAGATTRAADEPEIAGRLRELGVEVTVRDGVVVGARADTLSKEGYRVVGECTSLRTLSVSGAAEPLSAETLPLLAGLVNLESLNTNQSRLADDDYRLFAPLRRLERLALYHPSIRMPEFTGRGLAHLAALPALEELTYAGTDTGDEALAAVGTLKGLRRFRTWHTAQTQAGMTHLATLENLVALRLGQRLPGWGSPEPSFDGSTIPVIAGMKTLEQLELTEARLTATDLAPLAGLPKLRLLVITTVDIPPADVEKLRAELPGVKIEFTPLSDEEREKTLVKKLKVAEPARQ